ncbi:MAG TPA: succinate dehydrogenase/fumarate reductase flavoprotein subunit, partial [Megasphaera stantonii]|nr:succinate dehydrogenase/fumarate reductase flavoprotein subunit [Megasphaera stantonii]
MKYTEEMLASQACVDATRNERLYAELRRYTAQEKQELLRNYHPDYSHKDFSILMVGPNKGDKVPSELAAVLEGKSRLLSADFDLSHIEHDADVLII